MPEFLNMLNLQIIAKNQAVALKVGVASYKIATERLYTRESLQNNALRTF